MEDRRLLDSWKEIAAYLNRSVMTCHRWEEELGLPVHRLDGTPKARVFAYSDEIDRWMEREHRKHAKSRLKALFAAAAALFVAIAAVLFIWKPWIREGGPPKFSSDRPSIAILNLANRTGQKDLDHYRDVFAHMISYDLSQSKYIYVVPADQVYSILTRLGLLDADTFTTENLRSIGRRGVVRYLASGFYAKAGERFLVSLTIHEAESGKVVGSEDVQTESVERFFTQGVDDLARKIKPLLELTAVELANDIDSPLERVTTSSIEAYEYYLKAARLVGAGKNREAIKLLEKAVSIDLEFAMAYSNLAAYYSNLGSWGEWRKSNDKALEFSKRQDRVSLRERLLIEGMSTRNNEERVRIYSRLLETYPEDFMGNFLLAVVYDRLDEPERAAERYLVLTGHKTEIPYPYHNLAGTYCRLGDFARAEMVLEDFIRDFPGHPGIGAANQNLAHIYLVQSKFDRALEALDEGLRLDPQLAEVKSRAKGIIFVLMGEFDRAEEELQGLLRDADAPESVYFLWELAHLYKHRGRFGMAKEALRRAQMEAEKNDLFQQWEYLAGEMIENDLTIGDIGEAEAELSGLAARIENQNGYPRANETWLEGKTNVLLKKKNFEEAAQYASAYKALSEKGMNRRAARYPLRLKGVIELEKGNYAAAIDLLLKAKSLLWSQFAPPNRPDEIRQMHASFMEPLARAYFQAGDLKRAREEYEAITRLTTGRLAYGDLYARSFYMLGQIYERLGNMRRSRANYLKFLDLWKDADPIFPEIEDAKARLAKLEAR